MTQLRKPPERGNLRSDENWYRETTPDGGPRKDVSWHFKRTDTTVPGDIESVCGLVVERAQVSVDPLPRGKTCESCLRLDREGIVKE